MSVGLLGCHHRSPRSTDRLQAPLRFPHGESRSTGREDPVASFLSLPSLLSWDGLSCSFPYSMAPRQLLLVLEESCLDQLVQILVLFGISP